MTDTREPATVTQIRVGPDPDRGLPMLFVLFEGKGWGQAIDILIDADHVPDTRREMCQLFGAPTVGAIVGAECYALRNEPFGLICGIESAATGKRWTRVGFCRRRGYDHPESELESKRASLRRGIDNHLRRIQEALRDLDTLGDRFVEWKDTL